MLKMSSFLFFNILVTSTMITISSYSWLSMWMGLEFNLMSIIPLLMSPPNLFSSETALKYFITQTMASSVLLCSITVTMSLSKLFPRSLDIFLVMMLNSALLMKMGAAPFHMWFPEIMEGLTWVNSLIMLTWQKIAPMILLMYHLKTSILLVTSIIFSSMISGTLGINQVSLRKILAYSSINHIGWMIASMLVSSSYWLVYFSIYSSITFNVIMVLYQSNSFYLKQLITNLNYNKLAKLIVTMNFLSLGGLPPLLGFFPKWITISTMISSNFITMSVVLIIFTLVTLYFYTRISYSALAINIAETPLTPETPKIYHHTLSNLITLTTLFGCSLIYPIL
uniref:NADH-ubiquinone oxidoreductase chain 2 n=1 Tax=Obrium sp. NS-2015 TaxID=1776756 RepID=A0A0U3TPR3_9CUCU|nr:NADH dehydrogenase subunit 2 [Obrium sp. NS-2015]